MKTAVIYYSRTHTTEKAAHSANLMVAFHFDLDQWSTLPTFDGGNVKFRANF